MLDIRPTEGRPPKRIAPSISVASGMIATIRNASAAICTFSDIGAIVRGAVA